MKRMVLSDMAIMGSRLMQAPRVLCLLVCLPLAALTGTTVPTGQIDFHMRVDGLYPKTITVSPGTYRIVLTNGVFRAPLDLSITPSGGSVATQTAVAQTATGNNVQHRQGLTVTLAAGQYTAQIVGHSNWTAKITVQEAGSGK